MVFGMFMEKSAPLEEAFPLFLFQKIKTKPRTRRNGS
jgi:hypothetical protein